MDFLQEVFIKTDKEPWQASPMAGVWRKPLAREEAERGHATSVVKYDAGSFFRSHPHPGGEEIFVIKGVFSDESGDYPAGSYFRNPPGTSHAPHSKDGCELFVKLHQFSVTDRKQINIDTNDFLKSGKSFHLLHEHQNEKVFWIRLNLSSDLTLLKQLEINNNAVELLVIKGELEYKEKSLNQYAWLRVPCFNLDCFTFKTELTALIKLGHF